MRIFRPCQIIQTFDALDIYNLKQLGLKNILIDVDNTIALPDVELTASDRAKKFIKDLKDNGFNVLIYSNSTFKRVKPMANSLDCKFECWCFKPLPFRYWMTLIKHNFKIKETCTLGDQLLTDCLGANLIGLYSIYTKQLTQKDIRQTIINRYFERLIFKYILHEKV